MKYYLLKIFFIFGLVLVVKAQDQYNYKINDTNIIEFVQLIGSKSNGNIKSYNLFNLHQSFIFEKSPLPVKSGENFENFDEFYSEKESIKLDNLLKGFEEIKNRKLLLLDSLKDFGDCFNPEFEKRISLYKELNQATQIIDLGDLWIKYSKKIQKSCNWTPEFLKTFNGIFIKTNVRTYNRAYKYYYLMDKSYGQVDENSKDGIKFYKILDKILKKHPEVIVPAKNKTEFIKKTTGLDERFFKLKEENERMNKLISYIERNCFLTLPTQIQGHSKFLYIGASKNGAPEGYGYLLNQKKQLVATANWKDGFPTLIFRVNIYLNPEGNAINYSYFCENENTNKYINLIGLKWKELNQDTYDLYIGDFRFNETSSSAERNGYGCYFSNAKEKTSLIYYRGNWSNGKRNGKGTYLINGIKFEGNFLDHELNYGKCTWLDGGYYEGELNNYRASGMGRYVSSIGIIKEGLFENGNLVKSKAQIEQEKIELELSRIRQEELKLEEARKREDMIIAEAKKKEEDIKITEKEKLKNVIVLKDAYDLVDSPKKYFGKVVMLVGYPSRQNKYVFHQREQMTVYPDGYFRNQQFKNTQFYIDDMKTTTEYVNWKQITERNSGIEFTINIPNNFFENDLIPEARSSSSLYDFYLEVYPMNENRSSNLKGKYNTGGSSNEPNFELLKISRHK